MQVREVGRKVAQPPDPVTRLAVPPLVPHGPRRRSMSEESGRARRSAEQERENSSRLNPTQAVSQNAKTVDFQERLRRVLDVLLSPAPSTMRASLSPEYNFINPHGLSSRLTIVASTELQSYLSRDSQTG